jgi:predicted glycoside hydrolase/deacetylase ChbG (UPF0249 family)
MRFCIVNADDFGAGAGINRGIGEAHRTGIVTSTSLMVNMPGTQEAVELARTLPRLSVGLHVNLTNENGPPVVDRADTGAACREILSQWDRFEALTGRSPTHLDAHHNVHRDPLLAPFFIELAQKKGVPLRENCEVRYFSNFYGQWDGETHLEQISVETLLDMLEAEVREGFTELSCHPGWMSEDFPTEYGAERQTELATLCDPRIGRKFVELGLHLINYQDYAALRRIVI